MITEEKIQEIQDTVIKDSSASLLEDASTLLMFHNAAVSNNETDKHKENKQLPSSFQVKSSSISSSTINTTTTTTTKSSKSSSSSSTTTKLTPLLGGTASLSSHVAQHMTSPGPAIAALAGYTTTDGERDKSQKAIVAAAALAAAAGIPFPLLNGERNETVSIDEHLRSSSIDLKEAVRATANEIPEDHINALQETAKEIREKVEHDKENDTTMKDNVDNRKQDNKPVVKKSGRKGKYVPKDYVVDPDLGVITCVCESEEDDGFTIQCDHCYRWQHAVCMDIDPDFVPENYLCNVCQPRKVDVKRAKQLQTERMELLKKNKDKEDANTELNNKDSREEKSNSNIKEKDKKERNKPKPTNYGKNLEETDIEVPDPKDSYLTSFYELETYDYQDELVYHYVNNQQTFDVPSIIQISTKEYKELQKPKIKVKPYSDVNNKKFNGISKLGLFTEEAIKENDLIEEYLGEINFKDRYVSDARNHYRIWGVEKPQVSFISNTPLVIDARSSGNFARFTRRSCNPNSEIKIIKVANDSIKFFLVAKKAIKPNSELTIGWNWDPNHSIRGIIEGTTFDQTNDACKPSLVLSVESILTFVECACTSNNECALLKVKKASAHIYRSTRKGNNISGRKLLTKDTQYISIQERLLQRELSNQRDSSERVTTLPIISTSNDNETEIVVKPFIYHYVKKKRKFEVKDGKIDYLPIPLSMILNDEKKDVDLEKNNTTKPASKPVKKLTFADYKKKKKPN